MYGISPHISLDILCIQIHKTLMPAHPDYECRFPYCLTSMTIADFCSKFSGNDTAKHHNDIASFLQSNLKIHPIICRRGGDIGCKWSTKSKHLHDDTDVFGLVQERCNSSALAMELHLSCINPCMPTLILQYGNQHPIISWFLVIIGLKWWLGNA